MSAKLRVQFDEGILLPDVGLALDPHRPRARAVVTHAHADHVQPHQISLATAATAALVRRRGGSGQFQLLRYREPLELSEARLTLYPAGHILGSAQALVELDRDSVLYSGDFKLRPGQTCERAEVPRARTVVMETTFARPYFRMPPVEEVTLAMAEFCRQTLSQQEVPVLFCYSLGKCQELVALLGGLDFPLFLPEAHWEMTTLYRDLGVPLPAVQRLQPGDRPRGAVLCAIQSRTTPWFRRLGRTRTAYVSGWALAGGAKRFGTDTAFALSDHADYAELLEYVEKSGAERVYTLHGYTDAFAADLRKRGLWAEPLRAPGPQLTLDLE